MKLLQNQEFPLDEILFRNKNKNYGAYVLRQNSDRILTKAAIFGMLLFATISVAPLVVNAFKSDKIVDKIPIPAIPYDLTPIPEEVIPPAQNVQNPQQNVSTSNSTVPTPTANTTNDVDYQDVPEDAIPGTQTTIGDPPTGNFLPPIIQPNPGNGNPGTGIVPPEIPEDNNPAIEVDVKADFKGGIDAFRNKVLQNFDTSDFDGSSDKISATITFIVEKDGSISEVKANGKDAVFNKEAERTIRNIKGGWIPAKIKGKPVRSYFRFPISMVFQ
ncbi:MAG: energy transducer TonB [Flavobacteriaceae bacterium]|jgi:protein TonB|nr:energy transducer TonB [Flavobacteriaceae bacterium]